MKNTALVASEGYWEIDVMGERASHVGVGTCLYFVNVTLSMMDKHHKHAVTMVAHLLQSALLLLFRCCGLVNVL